MEGGDSFITLRFIGVAARGAAAGAVLISFGIFSASHLTDVSFNRVLMLRSGGGKLFCITGGQIGIAVFHSKHDMSFHPCL